MLSYHHHHCSSIVTSTLLLIIATTTTEIANIFGLNSAPLLHQVKQTKPPMCLIKVVI